MGKVTAAALLAAILLAGCQTTGGGKGGAFCDVARPQRPSKAVIAVMSDAERRQALAALRYGAEHCGWRP